MAWKKTVTLGRQAIPNFAREATVIECARCLSSADGTDYMPETGTIYDQACLVFFRRGAVKTIAIGVADLTYIANQPLAISYWSNNPDSGATHRYSLDKVVIPAGAEWYSLSWFSLPATTQGNDPSPADFPPAEDLFRVRWGLSI
jgi:hypothetical protein